jgi:hypothetical protein
MSVEHFFASYYTQTTLSALVALFAFLKFNSRSSLVKLIGCSFLLSFICNALGFVLLYTKYSRYQNVPQSVFYIINICILTAFYFVAFRGAYRVWLVIAISICLPFSFYDIVIQQKSFLESYSPFAQSLFLITFTILYFYRLLVELPAIHLHRLPMFWFNSAILFYYAGASFLFAFTSYLINVLNNSLLNYWTFHNSLSIVEHLIILIGLFFDFKALNSNTQLSTY